MSMIRTRWAAVGAAVAVTLGAGGVSLSQAAINSGDKPVYVSITPCRLIDTRGTVGPRTSPLGAGDTLTLQVTGSTGQCEDIPADAVAAAMNVTAIRGTTRSFLTVYPQDAALPNASNLNWNGGDPPTPNKVDVALSASGAVKMSNDAGTVHIAADLVGYYTDHTHDDRYYTKNQTDGAIATAVAGRLPADGVATDAEKLDGATPSAYRVYFLTVDGLEVKTFASSPELVDTVVTRRTGQPVGHFCIDLPDAGSFSPMGVTGSPTSRFSTGLGGTADELQVLAWANDGCLSDGADLSVRLARDGTLVDAPYVLLVPGR